ncbi:hypothetical protein [Veronia pacifica]|uniref:Cytochrome P460 domain-containing protein n=1 Tax=Veronia pacifica TaxID=1080227 RepID=A0A1C3EQY7_9GAMM|nr:hypothetical protein [Veronia pacifica]ODA35622.1 hypothetical protein A8L45_03100 [Veronia pacifica]
MRIPIFLCASWISFSGFCSSNASFPDDIENMVRVKQSIIPGRDVVLPESTPTFLQETVKMYNWINNGQGTTINIFVPENKVSAYKTHGPYEDGVTAVAIYEDQDIIFVTEHLAGEPLYGTYDRLGNDISHTHPSFNVSTCNACHNGYRDICRGGTCATPIIDVFKPKK